MDGDYWLLAERYRGVERVEPEVSAVSIAALLRASSGGDFEGPAALLPWKGKPLIDHVLGRMADWPVDEVLAVIGMHEDDVLEKAKLAGATILIDPGWKEGTASATRVGLDMLTRRGEFDAVVITDVLVPNIGVDVVERLVERYLATERYAVTPKYRYAHGAPYVVGVPLWGRLMGMEGESAIDGLLTTHPEWVEEVWFDELPPRSITTMDDLRDAQRRH